MCRCLQECPDVRVHHPRRSLVHRHPYRLQRRPRRAPGSEAVGAVPETRLEDRLHHQLGGLLHDPITDAGYPQRAPFCGPAGFGDVHAPHWLGSVSAADQFGPQLLQERVHATGFDGGDAVAVDARGTPVGLHLHPRPRQDVRSGHLVVERMEPPPWRSLGGPVERPLQFLHRVLGVASRHRHSPARTCFGAHARSRGPFLRPRCAARSSSVLRPPPTPSRPRSDFACDLYGLALPRRLVAAAPGRASPVPWSALSTFRSSCAGRFIDAALPSSSTSSMAFITGE